MFRFLLLFHCFIFLNCNVYGQQIERTFEQSEIERLNAVDSLSPNIWKMSFSYGWGGSGPNYSQELQALYYRKQDSLGPLKMISHYSMGYRYHLPLFELSATESVWIQYYESYPFVSARWIDLEDSSYREFQDYYDYMAASLNWQFQRDTTFALFNTRTFEAWSELRMGSDSIFLVQIENKSANYQILDTFLLESPIISPGSFFLSDDGSKFKYINDSLHYHFTRGKKEADSVYVDQGDFYGGPKGSLSREAHFAVNFNTFLNYEKGKKRIVFDSLGADLLLLKTLEDGTNLIERKLVYPYQSGSSLPAVYGFKPQVISYNFQDSNITTLQYISAERDSFAFFRMEGDTILAQQRFIVPSNQDFQIRQVQSFADNSFLLAGSIAHGRDIGWDAWSRPHFKLLGPNGSKWWNDPKAPFQLYYDARAASLTIFFPDLVAKLDYRIIDASGRSLQSGSIKAHEEIPLGNWSTALYYLQLWNQNGNYYGQQPFLKTRN